MVKNQPTMQETLVRSLGWEDPLEKGMATHSSTLAWRILWTEEPGGLLFMGPQSWTRLSNSTTTTESVKTTVLVASRGKENLMALGHVVVQDLLTVPSPTH